jgi:hypothetical protein
MSPTVGSVVLLVLAANCSPSHASAHGRVGVPISMGGTNDGPSKVSRSD